eukprot:gene15918-21594_t
MIQISVDRPVSTFSANHQNSKDKLPPIMIYAPNSPNSGPNSIQSHGSSPTTYESLYSPVTRTKMVGYSGHISVDSNIEPHVLDSPFKRIAIRGYSGFRPQTLNIIGQPIIPSEEKQLDSLSFGNEDGPKKTVTFPKPGLDFEKRQLYEEESKEKYRSYVKDISVVERYADAIDLLAQIGQTQSLLLSIVQSKIAERVNTYANQLIRVRKLFEGFSFKYEEYIDEHEFRSCLEKINVQFDDTQCLALFAYFDDDNDGYIKWIDFAETAMVTNPGNGTSVLPKIITETHKTKESLLITLKRNKSTSIMKS